jgi:hypothetical protein
MKLEDTGQVTLFLVVGNVLSESREAVSSIAVSPQDINPVFCCVENRLRDGREDVVVGLDFE